jgi:hypothetical protein
VLSTKSGGVFMKRKSLFLAIAIAAVLALAGCSGKKESNTSVVSDKNVQPVQAENSSGNKTITVETVDYYSGTFIFLLHATQEEVPLMTSDVTISSGEIDVVQCTGTGVDDDGITKSRWSVHFTSSANAVTITIKKNEYSFVPSSFDIEVD